jgi:hypothetical protein
MDQESRVPEDSVGIAITNPANFHKIQVIFVNAINSKESLVLWTSQILTNKPEIQISLIFLQITHEQDSREQFVPECFEWLPTLDRKGCK